MIRISVSALAYSMTQRHNHHYLLNGKNLQCHTKIYYMKPIVIRIGYSTNIIYLILISLSYSNLVDDSSMRSTNTFIIYSHGAQQ